MTHHLFRAMGNNWSIFARPATPAKMDRPLDYELQGMRR
jgi:hypothetical protein